MELSASEILGRDDIDRAVVRIAHEIIERGDEPDDLVIVGLQSGGSWLAARIAAMLGEIPGGSPVPVGVVDVSPFRDDAAVRPMSASWPTEIPVDLTDRVVVLVDDVLQTGRTVRAALEALNAHGRPRAVRLAVMIDRGHRELPIRPDHVGRNLPTHPTDEVEVGPSGVLLRRCDP
jgi:pyrimidine operon attenuation protein/uracil phosphoribosyltransferase